MISVFAVLNEWLNYASGNYARGLRSINFSLLMINFCINKDVVSMQYNLNDGHITGMDYLGLEK